jgi:NADH dehydrogenase/NADH:ubiquinone oxidoreductase subunit G
MADMINLTIDGKRVKAPEGSTLIEAADMNGLHIPNLCYLKGSRGVGACRLCMVEIEGLKAPMLGCTTRVKEDMIINTKTEKVTELRKFVIDLILSMHPLDCMTCTKAGVCDLQRYAYELEIKESSFTRKKFGYPIDEANPFIKRDPDYCVLCGRCVRVCKNQGTKVLEFMGRGVGSRVVTADDKPLQESGCTFCGSCVDVCPVNALLEADRWRKGREWEYESVDSVCLLCGNACDITVSTKDGCVMKVNAGKATDPVERYICAFGRYGFDSIEADSRLTAPMKRVDGALKQTTWEDALTLVGSALKKAGSNAGFISTGSLLNEDALTLARFSSDVVKTKNVDTTVSLYGTADTLLSDSADLLAADVVVLVDLDPNQWGRVMPALDALIRRKVANGAKLVTVNSKEIAIASVAAASLIGNETVSLKSIARAMIAKGLKADKKLADSVSSSEVTEVVEKAATLVADAANPVILTSTAMYGAAANLGAIKGVTVSVPLESNAKGTLLMGLSGKGKSYSEMASSGAEVLYVVGEVTAKKRPNTGFLVVQASHLTELAKQADVVLPSAAYLESDGTIVDYIGSLRQVSAAVTPAGSAKANRAIFVELAKAMGADLKEAKESETKKAAKVKTKSPQAGFSRREGLDADPAGLKDALNASIINESRLLWLKETAKAAVA